MCVLKYVCLFRCCRCSRRPLPLGDGIFWTFRCVNLEYWGRFDAKNRPMRPLNGSQIVQKSISNRHKVGFWGFNGSLKDFSKESWAPRGGMNPIWPRNPRKTCGKSGQLDPKTEQKSTYKSIIFPVLFKNDLLFDFCGFWKEKWCRNGGEINGKSMPTSFSSHTKTPRCRQCWAVPCC